VAVADAGPPARQFVLRRLTDARTLLVASPYFILERLDLPSQSDWEFHAEHETWLLVEGDARVGLMNAFVGDAVYLDAERTSITAGRHGLKGLVAYLATEPSRGLLHKAMTGARLHSMEAGL
jgi:mannose-6-phosphate isomerase